MTIEDVAALILGAIEAQCAEGAVPREAMIEADDFSSVSLEGSFDIRAIAAHVLAGLPKNPLVNASEAGSVQFDGKGGLTINIAPGALGKINETDREIERSCIPKAENTRTNADMLRALEKSAESLEESAEPFKRSLEDVDKRFDEKMEEKRSARSADQEWGEE